MDPEVKRLLAQYALLAFVAGCESTVIGSAGSSPEASRHAAHPTPTPSSSSSTTSIPSSEPNIEQPPSPTAEDAGAAPEPEGDPTPTPAPCRGDATACRAIPFDCAQQQGCTYDGIDCEGKPVPCAAFTTHAACYEQWGCEWIAE